MKITTLLLMTSLVFTLSACEESDDDGDGDVGVGPTINELPDDTTNGPTAGLAGLWDDTTDNGENGVDVVYLEFRSNNTGTAYDYQGDSFNQGDNCYVATELVIQNLGDDRYTIADVDFPNVGSPITANISRGDLIVEDVEGTEILPALEGLSPTDFNICSEVPSETGNGSSVSLVGLWDATTEESSTGSDVFYLEFRSDNTGTAYDFQGDSFGNGDNCYEARELIIDDLGNSRYTITVAGVPDSAQTVTADISGDNLLFTDSEGTDTLTALTGVSPSDFNICTELPSETGNGGTAGLAGLWDDTTDNGENGVDVVYLEFRSNNTGTAYDYQGDSFNQGDNCYVATELVIQNLGDDRYTIADVDFPNVGSPITANIFRGDLIVEDVEGTEILPALEGLSPTDFNICSEVPSETGNGSSVSLVGLWNDTTDEGADGVDVSLIEISSNSTWTVYDYLGDSFDQGDDCYQVTELLVEELGENVFLATNANDSTQSFMFFASLVDGNLALISGEDSNNLPPVVGLTTSDFNPCS